MRVRVRGNRDLPLAHEPTDFGPVRVSLRSKGTVDVARFAETFGGGGHARAAGLKLEGVPFEQAHDAVVSAMAQWMQKPAAFWEYKEQVYKNQEKLSAFTFDDFARGFAADHDLDLKKYDADLGDTSAEAPCARSTSKARSRLGGLPLG